MYATIRETSTGVETFICGGDERTQSDVYVSEAHSVEVQLNDDKQFMLLYEGNVIGISNIFK